MMDTLDPDMADSWINYCFLTADEYIKRIRKMYQQHKMSYKDYMLRSALAKRQKSVKVYKPDFASSL